MGMMRSASEGRVDRIALVVPLAMTLGWGMTSMTDAATELRFVVADLAKDLAIWHPNFMYIRPKDLKERLVFILENPTDNLHSFVVEDLFEEIPMTIREMVAPGKDIEVKTYSLQPIGVIIPPRETKRVHVNTILLERASGNDQHFRFYCHVHESEHVGGVIFVPGRPRPHE